MHFYIKRLIQNLEKTYCRQILDFSSNLRNLGRKNSTYNSRHFFPVFLTSKLLSNKVFYKRRRSYYSSPKQVMSETQPMGLPLNVVVDKLKQFASPSLAESWDNVGLLVEPVKPKDVKKIMLTNDLTEEVMEEAVEMKIDLIISYHPPIFAPLKSVTTRTWKERLVAMCLENKIALYSPHTSFDSVKGGVNDWLASAFETKDVTPLVPAFNTTNTNLVEVTFPNTPAGNAAVKDFQIKWMGIKGEGDGDSVCQNFSENEILKLAVPCAAPSVTKLVGLFNSTAFGSEMDRLKVLKYEKVTIAGHGMGRMCTLKYPLSLGKVIEIVKTHINRPYVKVGIAVGKDLSSLVNSIAICAGSGASLLRGIGADLYLTGEMLHHDILDATHNGTHVILCNHSDSERGFLLPFSRLLSDELLEGKVHIVVSKKDKDPLTTM